MFTYTQKAISTAATFLLALLVAFSTLLISTVAAPEAQAAPTNTNFTYVTNTNHKTFKQKKVSYFSISVKAASSKGGKGLRGKAQLKVNGKVLRTRVLQSGSYTFHVSRKDLPNNRTAEVAVRTWPHDDGRPSQVVKWDVKDVPKKASSSPGQKVVKVAKQQIGERYKYGSSGPNAFDCSGLVVYSYKKATGRNLPHSSSALKNVGKKISKVNTKPGDLAVSDGHVSIVATSGAKKVVEAANPKSGVRTAKLWQKNVTYVRP